MWGSLGVHVFCCNASAAAAVAAVFTLRGYFGIRVSLGWNRPACYAQDDTPTS